MTGESIYRTAIGILAMLVLGAFNPVTAWGMWNLKSWAKKAAIVLTVLGLLAGVIFIIGVLYFLLMHEETKRIFEDIR